MTASPETGDGACSPLSPNSIQLRTSSLQHPEPTRDSQSSRNARKLLRTNNGAPLYPRRISSAHNAPSIRLRGANGSATNEPARSSLPFDHPQLLLQRLSNRYTERLEMHVSHRKQTTAYSSNRYNFHLPNAHSLLSSGSGAVSKYRVTPFRERRALTTRHVLLTTHYSLPW